MFTGFFFKAYLDSRIKDTYALRVFFYEINRLDIFIFPFFSLFTELFFFFCIFLVALAERATEKCDCK